MKQQLRVLLLGSDEKEFDALLQALKEQTFDVGGRHIALRDELIDALSSASWDVVFYRYSTLTLHEVLMLISATEDAIPVFVIAEQDNEGLRAMSEGAVDYFCRGRFNRLGPAVRRELESAKNRDQLKKAKAKLDAKRAELEKKEARARQVETHLKEEASRRQILMNSSRDGIAIINQEHRIVEANQRFAEMLGYEPEELLSLHTWDFEAIMSEAEIRVGFDDLTQTSVTFEIRHRDKDGTLHDVEVSVSGALVGDEPMVFTVSRDITEKKKMQANLAQSDRLASISMLAAGVAHEINNPLAYVLLHLQALSKELPALEQRLHHFKETLLSDLPDITGDALKSEIHQLFSMLNFEKINKRIREAHEGTRRIQTIAGALSTFSRVERQRLTPVDVHYTIECAANMAFNEIKYRARLVKEFGEISNVLANEGHLSQVFLNLLINAVHAIEDGNAADNEIRIRTYQKGDDVFIEVRDTGKGISPDNLDRIFDPFFTTKNIGEGSGLGLTISRNIVVGYGGRIDVESTEGKGSNFVIRIPIRTPRKQACREEKTAVAKHPTSGKILIIDDEVSVLEAMEEMLPNHNVITASSGKKGMALTKLHSDFDLVLCDLMMPDISGMSFHKWLRTTYPHLADRLVFISGGATTPDTRVYLSQVDNLCIHKPFDPESLSKKVCELIEYNQTRYLY